ncbi:MAG: LPS assembly lipoprotein LptE [Burkholderiaceae bacterium]
MQRRLLLAQCGAWALAGCGFELRKAPTFAFDSIYVNVPESSPLANELKRNLASLKSLQLITDPAQQSKAQVVLEIPIELREKTVVGVNASGQVREFQIRLRVHFLLRTPQGKVLIPETEILQQRDISFNESAVLAKEAEEGLMYRDMQSDIVQQLLRRLAAVKSL